MTCQLANVLSSVLAAVSANPAPMTVPVAVAHPTQEIHTATQPLQPLNKLKLSDGRTLELRNPGQLNKLHK